MRLESFRVLIPEVSNNKMFSIKQHPRVKKVGPVQVPGPDAGMLHAAHQCHRTVFRSFRRRPKLMHGRGRNGKYNHESSQRWNADCAAGLNHLHPKLTNSRLLAPALAAPFSSSSRTHSSWPLLAAMMRAVQPQARQGSAIAGKLPLSPSSSF